MANKAKRASSNAEPRKLKLIEKFARRGIPSVDGSINSKEVRRILEQRSNPTIESLPRSKRLKTKRRQSSPARAVRNTQRTAKY